MDVGELIERVGARIGMTPGQIETVRRVVARHGPFGVFAARFIPGRWVMAGPLAGASGLRVRPFPAANALGAALSVPLAVRAGYAVGYCVTASSGHSWPAMGEAGRIGLIGSAVWAVIWVIARCGGDARRSRAHPVA
jgi:membrane-associated protein